MTSGCASKVTKHHYSTQLQRSRSTETQREATLQVRRGPGFVHLRLGEAKFCVTSERELTVGIHETRSRPDIFWFVAEITLATAGLFLLTRDNEEPGTSELFPRWSTAGVFVIGAVATGVDISKFGKEREESIQAEHERVVGRQECGYAPRGSEPISLVTAEGQQHSLTDRDGRASFQLEPSQAADVWVDKRPQFHIPAQAAANAGEDTGPAAPPKPGAEAAPEPSAQTPAPDALPAPKEAR